MLSRRLAYRPPALLVLAGGASRRHLGLPKALLEIDGHPAVLRILMTARDAGITNALVVVGPHRIAIRDIVKAEGVRVAENPLWELGRTGSVQVGLEELGDVASVLLWPVDRPFAHANTLEALSDRAQQDAVATWLIPAYHGRGGHPVLLKRPVFEMIHGLNADEPLRSLLPRLGVQVARIPVGDPWVLVDTDTPEAYRQALDRRRDEGALPWTGS